MCPLHSQDVLRSKGQPLHRCRGKARRKPRHSSTFLSAMLQKRKCGLINGIVPLWPLHPKGHTFLKSKSQRKELSTMSCTCFFSFPQGKPVRLWVSPLINYQVISHLWHKYQSGWFMRPHISWDSRELNLQNIKSISMCEWANSVISLT